MRIKNQKGTTGNSKGILFGVLLLVLVLFGIQLFKGSSAAVSPSKATNPLETATRTKEFYSLENIIENKINAIYEDDNVIILLNESLGMPFMLYAYKEPVQDRYKTDYFFLHVYLEDDEQFKKQRKTGFLNFDFRPFEPLKLTISGKNYQVYKRKLEDEFFDLENIKYINTGRYNQAGGGRSQDIRQIEVSELNLKNVKSELPNLTLQISEKSFEKIREKRDKAIENSVLLTSEDDLVKGFVSFEDSEKKEIETRLKGDWTDHLNHPSKWSYRVIVQNGETVSGMRKFSIQHPKARNYLWEWLFNKVVKDNDLIGLRYDFVEVDLELTSNKEVTKTIPMGIMAREESFDKILIENNNRREGVIIALDESPMWNEREQHFRLKQHQDDNNGKYVSNEVLPIRVFNENKVLADPNLSKQFETAKDLLQSLREGKLKISEVFDLDKLTTYVALANLFGGDHGMIDHNLRIYYNPITGKLEPISFDSYPGNKLEKIILYPFSEGDPVYTKALTQKLQWVSTSDFVQEIAQNHLEEMKELHAQLSSEYRVTTDLSTLDFNSNFIKKNINPADAIIASLHDHSDTEISVLVKNISEHPVVVDNLIHKDGKKLNDPTENDPIAHNSERIIKFPLKAAFANAFVSKKNKVGGFNFPKDVAKLRLTHHVLGLDYTREQMIAPYGSNQNLDQKIIAYENRFGEELKELVFAEIDDANKTIVFKKGKNSLNQTIKIPENYRWIVEAGFELDMSNGASIISFSAINAQGTEKEPVRFFSSEGNSGGIFVDGPEEKSIINHAYFSNLSNPSSAIWSLSGAVNFHETIVEINHAVFEKNRCEDALNIIRSNFTMSESMFENTFSDAFDGDFVKGTISNCTFNTPGNDGIDVSGSELILKDIRITNPSDKAISAGENSSISGSNIMIEGGEIGIVSKDFSSVNLMEITMNNTRLGFSSFQKKSEYGKASIEAGAVQLNNIEVAHLIENGCKLVLNSQLVETVSNNVIDQMYGKEFGKSSR